MVEIVKTDNEIHRVCYGFHKILIWSLFLHLNILTHFNNLLLKSFLLCCIFANCNIAFYYFVFLYFSFFLPSFLSFLSKVIPPALMSVLSNEIVKMVKIICIAKSLWAVTMVLTFKNPKNSSHRRTLVVLICNKLRVQVSIFLPSRGF